MKFTNKNTPNEFYVYLYLREDNTPYYVGKGKGARAWRKGKGEVYPPTDFTKIKISAHNLTESEAFTLEKKIIKIFGRKDNSTGILRNKSDGGEGPSGRIQTAQEKAMRAMSLTGLAKSEKHKTNLSIAHSGKSLSTTHKNKISVSGKKRFEDGAEKARMSKKMTGAGNSNAAVWELTSPEGEQFCVIGLKEYCRINGIREERIRLSQCGWKSINLGKKKNLINKE